MIRFISFFDNMFDMFVLNFSWRPALAFSIVLQQTLRISWNDQRQSNFLSDHESFFVLYNEKHYHILIIVTIVAKIFYNLFVLAWKCLIVCVAALHCRHPYQNINHLMILPSFELSESDSTLSLCKSSYSEVFQKSTICSIKCRL